MKLSAALLILAAVSPLFAQMPAAQTPTARPHPAAARTSSASACAKVPELSPKIPALPAGTPCAKHLYTITTIPTVKVENVSPMEPAYLKEDLGIESSTFSLDYIETKIGNGQTAGVHSYYTINYTGYLVDGTKFDSSYDHGEPITIPYGQHQVIPGWDTGFAGMKVGGKRRLIIPFQLAYGAQAKGSIPSKSMLIFDVELMGISDTAPKPKTPPAPPTPPAGAPSKPATPAAPGGTQPMPQPSAAPATPPVPPTTDPTKPTATPPKL